MHFLSGKEHYTVCHGMEGWSPHTSGEDPSQKSQVLLEAANPVASWLAHSKPG